MRAYVATTGSLFLVITIAHCVRMYFEPHFLGDVVYWLLTSLAVALALWAAQLLYSGKSG